MASSFFSPGVVSREGQLASLHLSHHNCVPVILSTTVSTADEQGYAEGVVTNTKFGSFPHTTLLNIPWGTQVRASKVDTGSRGRNPNYGVRKRKADAMSKDSPGTDVGSPGHGWREAMTASSGFLHVLPPTPETWTSSLPHRTQVVYTPDYSYILHRIKARPGSVLIEAGSGSGSFTHAAARAVYDGRPGVSSVGTNGSTKAPDARTRCGQVYTFEFHPERHEKVKEEMRLHALDGLVTASHRDVYRDGFLLQNDDGSYKTPLANTIFLDLPAPWEALKHLTREAVEGRPSALDPANAVHICTFSPCIEQAQKTISSMRKLGWIEIEMVEIQHKRIEIRRDFTGLKYDGMRAINAYAADVEEAVSKLRSVEQRTRLFHVGSGEELVNPHEKVIAQNAQLDAQKVLYNEGSIIHKSEPELKAHTSYLTFAILPRDWSSDDEDNATEMLQANIKAAPDAPKSQRQLKREAKLRKKLANGMKKTSEQDETIAQ